MQYNQLPLITLLSQKKAFNSLDKKQTQELLLFEQELQEVYTGDLEGEFILLLLYILYLKILLI